MKEIRDVLHQRQEILGKIEDNAGGYEFWISTDNPVASFISDDKQLRWKQSNGTLDTDWHHLAMTFDGKVVTLYIDGKFDVDMPDAFVMGIAVSNDLIIGDHSHPPYKGQWPFVGLIDEVRIYNRALSADEVKQNFLVSKPFKAAVTPAGKLAITWGEIKVSK